MLFVSSPILADVQGFSHLAWMPIASVVVSVIALLVIIYVGSRNTV